MKLRNTPVAALTCAVILGSAAFSQAAVILSEDFTYSDGALNGANGGTGFSNAWTSTTNVTSGVVTGNSGSERDFTGNAFGTTGTIWISFDWGGVQAPSSSSFGGLTFYDGVTERLLIGNTWESGAPDFTPNTVWDMNGSAPTVLVPNHDGMKTGVAKITLGAGATSTVELWVAATGAPVDVSGAPVATTTGRTLAGVNRFRINGIDFGNGSNSQSFDNLLVGTTMLDVDAIPEPSSALLGGLGMLALLRRKR